MACSWKHCHCHPKGPYYRDWVHIGTFLAFWVPIGSLFIFQGPYFRCFVSVYAKHRKNCECCHHHSVFKGHNVIVHIVVLNCQKCNQCLKCPVSGHKNFQKIWKLSKNLKTFKKSKNFPKIWKFFKNLKTFQKSENQQLSSTIVINNCHQTLS